MKCSATRSGLAEEFGAVAIAELVDYPAKAPVSVASFVTTLRVRPTRKGEQMAWIVISDGTAKFNPTPLLPAAASACPRARRAQRPVIEPLVELSHDADARDG